MTNLCVPFALLCATLIVAFASEADARTRRDVYVSPGAADGDGTRERPYGSIQEVLEKRQEDWGQVFLGPGVYREDVVIERDGVWFFPWRQYDVVIEGSFTIRGKGIALRGLTFRSQDRAIVVESSAEGCQVQNNRIVELANGGGGVHVEAGAVVVGNGGGLRPSEAKDTLGPRPRAGGGGL
ncbi:hypothetical protein H8D79_01855, partial [PVC group bacterium]|nr:hypothetical protein [PVC group bacterium]